MRHIAAAAIIVLATGAAGPFLTGNDLYSACIARTGLGYAECVGYVEGVLDTADIEGLYYMGNSNLHGFDEGRTYPESRDINGKLYPFVFEWCQPAGVTSGQFADVVVKFLRDNPEARQTRASIVVTQAMHKAWPCKR